ncbi:MAG TPA: adenylyl-sulfate kinase [Thermodesulfovibrionales bacterium]|nr:adenylyl-sulfate kinase [Thermodesulfovibrionales bacterium]
MDKEAKHLYWHSHSVTVKERRESYNYVSCVLWFTGLSAAGKSTLANALCQRLHLMGVKSYVLDGDNIRHGLNKNLGFSPEDRKENIRRIGEVAKLFVDAGVIAMTAFISPYREDRDNVRALLKEDEFIEIFLRCPIEECERRDPKGIYKKARTGEVKEFTGISAPYEEPAHPEIILDTDKLTLEEAVEAVMRYLIQNEYIKPENSREV